VGSHTIPLDPELEADLYVYGTGYLVNSTTIGLEHEPDQDHGIERGDDLDHDI
jgi:hypothetical protein